MNSRRLLKLADFLDKLPPKRFDFSHWVGDDWGGAQDLSCGTTACAIGWCPTIPAFRRLGLRIVKVDGFPAVAFKGQKRLALSGNAITERAAMRLFDLTQEEVEFLFLPSTACQCADGLGATPKRVARHIREFVQRGGLPTERS